MGAILIIVLLGLLLIGDWRKVPRARRFAPKRTAPAVVEATADPESMDRYFTAAVLAGVIDKAHYRAKMAALAATTELHPDTGAPSTISDPKLRAAVRLARQGTRARDLVRLLGITHSDAVRMIILARETETR